MAKHLRIAPELPAADVKAAREFYERKLGFKIAMEMPGGEYAIVERDGAAIHLFKDAARSHSPVGIHIFTADLEALYEEFKKSGADLTQGIVRKPWGNRDFRVRDEFGNEIKFTEPTEEG
jgi:uncharacterized glyoxalase superfamily protein PhnB